MLLSLKVRNLIITAVASSVYSLWMCVTLHFSAQLHFISRLNIHSDKVKEDIYIFCLCGKGVVDIFVKLLMSGLHTLYHTLSNTEAYIKQPQCQMGLSLLSPPHSQTLCTCKHWCLKIWLKYYTHTKLEANWWQWQLMGASCSLLHSHDKEEDWTKKKKDFWLMMTLLLRRPVFW